MSATTRLRLFYLFFYGTVGTYLPYFAAYLRGLGFSGRDIGLVQMTPSILQPVVALSWASYADHRASPQRALRLASAWAALAALGLPFVREPWQVALVIAAMSLGDRAVVPLVDSITLEWCREHPGKSTYTAIRLFGSVGFIALSLLAGWALTLRGDRPADLLVPVVVMVCVAAYALVGRGLPPTTGHPERPAARDLRAVATDRRLLLLLAAAAVHWAACAPYHLLLGVFVRDRALPSGVTGLAVGIGVTAEIAGLLLFPRLQRRVPLRGLFAAAFLGSAVRWLLLSQATGAVAVVGLQLAHALTFGVFWASSMHALAEAVPPQLRATGQAAFSALVFGVGNGAGYGLAGWGYDRLGGAGPLFALAAAAEVLALGILLAARRPAAPGRPTPPSGDTSEARGANIEGPSAAHPTSGKAVRTC